MKPEIRRAALRRVLAVYLHGVLSKYQKQQPQQMLLSESERSRRQRIRAERKGKFALVSEQRQLP